MGTDGTLGTLIWEGTRQKIFENSQVWREYKRKLYCFYIITIRYWVLATSDSNTVLIGTDGIHRTFY